MFRTVAAFVLLAFTFTSAPVFAAERPSSAPDATELTAPTPAVAEAWARESAKASGSGTLKALIVSYGVMQGLDMASTIAARNRGALEANPVMQGSYAQGMAVKAALGAVTALSVRAVAKKNRKAAIAMMIAANVATAYVVAHNMHNAQRLR